ncbi:MAG TPA: menaquinol-cytochrome c reductase cytochrome b subunit [Actinomycetota bacterium]|nr:menaquinol-cytochrome c reductase cytochrome b subunit [Actinomycetota bacterium]
MAETPDEVYERVLAEEQGKGSSPQVAQARAKAARMRASKGLPTTAAEAAAARSAESAHAAEAAPPPAQAPAAAAAAPAGPTAGGEDPEAAFTRVLAEEQAKGSSPAVAQARAKAARMRAQRGTSLPTASAGVPVGAGVAAATAAAPAASAAPRGRGSAARAARAASSEPVPERIQRLLAVVKPEAIQRVEKEPIDRVNTWPHLMAAEMLAILAATLFLLVMALVINAPFREMANINQTPNPSKAPWYFLGLQELLRYFHPQVAGVTIPQWIIVGFMAAPFVDRNPSTKPADRKLAIVLMTIFMCFFAVLVSVGVLFRGPGQNWVYPWKDGLFYLRNLDSLGEHGFEL